MPSDAPRAYVAPPVCADSANRLAEAMHVGPPARSRSRNTNCRDRTGRRSPPPPHSPRRHTADSFARAPPPTTALDKSPRCAHNNNAVPAAKRTAPKARGPITQSSPGPSPQFASRNRITKNLAPTEMPARSYRQNGNAGSAAGEEQKLPNALQRTHSGKQGRTHPGKRLSPR